MCRSSYPCPLRQPPVAFATVCPVLKHSTRHCGPQQSAARRPSLSFQDSAPVFKKLQELAPTTLPAYKMPCSAPLSLDREASALPPRMPCSGVTGRYQISGLQQQAALHYL